MSNQAKRFVVKASVTALDIKRGERGGYATCPWARAIKRSRHGSIAGISVDGDEVTITRKSGVTYHAETPRRVARFIERYDDGRKVRPTATATFRFKRQD